MAIDKRLKIYDDQGNEVDYDILATDVKFSDGKDLPTKMAELEDEIHEGGSGDGTVTGVKVGSTTYEPTDGVVDITQAIPDTSGKANKSEMSVVAGTGTNADKTTITLKEGTSATVLTQHQDISGKVDKVTGYGLSKNDYTDADKTAVATIPSKANDADVVKSISVNGTAQQKNNGNVNIVVEGIQGEKGEKGDTGNVEFEDLEDLVALLVNDLTTGGAGNFLSAEMGKRLKSKVEEVYQRVQSIYSLLGNIAFWDGKPASATILPNLDWGNPKHTVAITNNLSNSTITMNGNSVSGSFQAEEGSTVTLIVAPASGYALTGVSYVKDGGSSTSATSLGDGNYKIEFVMGSSDVAITVSGTAQQAYGVTLNLTNCTKTSGPTSVVSGGTATFVFAVPNGYSLPSSNPTVSGASVYSWDNTTGTLVIENVSGVVTIAITATENLPYEVPAGGDLLFWWDGLSVQSGDTGWTDRIGNITLPKASNSDAETTPDATKHCWKFEPTYNTQPHGLVDKTSGLTGIAPDNSTIEVVYKPTLFSDNKFNRANVCVFAKRAGNSSAGEGSSAIYFCAKGEPGAEQYICGCNANNVKDGTWAMDNVAGQIYCVGINNDNAVHNGSALIVNTGTFAQSFVTNYNSNSECMGIGAALAGGKSYGLFHGEIYAIRVYSGKLTAAQMLANQKVDNTRYGLGLTLPDTVQSNS